MRKLDELYATFVLPALDCNLNCAYCVIKQRNEASTSELTAEDYIRFFKEILIDLKIRRFSIQGYEPLLPETWPLTKELLQIAGAFFCESSVITNGTYLAEHAQELGSFPGLVDSLTVSLDGDRAEVHDKLRRTTGCFDAALGGLRAVSREFRGILMVNSVLFPGKTDYLARMPELLSQVGVREWAISPYIHVGKKTKVPNQVQMREDLLYLTGKASIYGIKVYLSDELRRMDGTDLYKDFYVRGLGVDEGIFRLSPDGSCSRGQEILTTSKTSPMWDRTEAPAAFLRRIFAEKDWDMQRRNVFARTIRRWHAHSQFRQYWKGGD